MPKFLDLDKVPMPACTNLAQLRQEIREAPFRFEHPGPSEQMYRQRPWPAFHNYIQRPPPQWRPYPSIGQSRNYRSHRPNKSEENKNLPNTNNPDEVNGKVTKDNSNSSSSSSSGTKKGDEKGSEINTINAQNVNESQCPNETSLEDVQENKSQSQTANNKVCDTTENNNALNTEKKSSNDSSESAKQQACSSNQKTVEAKATNSKNAETNGWKQIGMHKNSDELNIKSSTTSSKIKIGFTTPPVQNTVKKITINLKSSCSSALCSSENQTKTVSKIDGISRLENNFDKSDNLNIICDNQSAITNVKIPNNIVNSPSCKELFTKEDKISNQDSSILESSSGAITQSLKLSKTDSNSKLKEDICKSQTKTKSDILPDVFDIPLLSVSVSTKSDSFADNFDIPLLSQSPVSPETDNQNSALYFTPKSSPSDYSNDKKIQRENVTSAESSQKTDDFLNVRYINTTSTFLCPFGNEMQVVDMVMGSPLKPTKFFYDNGAEIQKSEDDITNALLKEMDNFCNSHDDKDKPTSNIKELVPKPTSENNKTTSNTIVETAKNNVEPKLKTLNNESLPINTIKDSTQATENTVLTDSQSEANIQAEIIKIVSQNKKSEDTIKELLLLGDKLSNCEETKDDKSTEKPIKESVTDTATLLSILEEIGDVSEKTTIKSGESPKVAIEKAETSNCKSVTPEPTKENVTLPREEKLRTKTPDSDTKKSKKHKFCGTSQYPDEELFKCKRKKIVKLDSDTSDEESHSNLQLIKRKKSMLICSSSEEEDNVKKIKRTKNNDTNTTQSESKEKGIDKNHSLLISNSNLPDVSVVLVKLPDPAKGTYLLTKSTSNTNVPPHGNIEDTVSKKNVTESSTKSEHNPSAKNVSTKSTDSSKSSTKREISSQKTPSVISSRRKSSARQKHSSSLPKLKTDNKIAYSASKITPGNDTATKNNTSNKVLHSASKIPHRRKSCATIQNNDSIKKQDESCSTNTNVLSDKKPAKGDSSKRRYSSVNEEIASSKTKSSNSHIDDKHRSSKRRSSHSNEKSNLPQNVSVQKIKDSRRESSSSTGSRKSSERSLKSTNRGSSSRSCSPCGTKKAEYLTKAHYEEKRSHTPSLKPIELSIAMTPKKLKTRRKTFDKEVNNQCILQEMSSLEKLRFIFGEDYAESDWCENQEKIKNEKKAARVRNKKKSTETVIQSSTEGDILLECDTLENDSRNFVSEIVITCENFELEATVLEDSDPLEVNLAASDIQIPNESVVESPDTNLESLNIQISPVNVLEHSEANLDPLNNQISSENTLKRPETKLNIKMAKESILEPSDFYRCCPYHTEVPKFDKVNNVNFLQNECTDTVYIFEQVSVSEDIQTITLPPPNSVNDDVVETTPPVPIIDLTDEGEPRTVERPRDMPKIEPEMFEKTANETITLYRAEEATDNSNDVQAMVASLNANSFLRGNVQTASDVKDEEYIKDDAPNAFEELVKDLHIENKEAPNKPVSEANETTSEQKSRLSESRPHSTHSATTETLAGSSLSSVHDDSELALPTHFIAVANAIESTNNSPQDAGSQTDTNTNLLQQIPNINTREKVSNVRPKSRDQLIAQQRRLSYESVANTNTTSDSGNFNLNNVQNVLSSESSSTNDSKADDTRHLAQQIPKSNTSVSNQLQNLRDQVITQQRRISFESVQSNQITEQRALSRESSSASPNSGNNASTVSNNISILPHNSQRRMSYESQHYVTNTNNTSNVNVGNRQSSLVSQNCLNNTALNNVQNQSNVQRRFSYESSPIPQQYAANTNALPNSIQSNGPNIDVHRYNQSVSTQRVLSPGTSLISQKVSTSSTFYPPHVDKHTNRQPEQTLLNLQSSQSYGSNTNVNQQPQQITHPESSRSYSLNSNNVIQQQNNLPGPSRMQETTSNHLELSRNYLFNSTNPQIHSSLNSNNVVQHRNTNFQPVLQQSTSTSGGSQIIYLLDRDVLAMGAIFAEHIIIYKALHTCLSALRQVQLIMSPNIQIEQGITEDRIKHHANQLSIALLQFNITANTNLNADCSKLIDHIVNVLNSGMYNMIITKSSVCLSMIDLMTPHKNKYITNLFFRSLFDTLTVIKNAMTQRVDSTNANQRQTNEERINNEPPTLRTIAPAQAARNRKAHNTKKTTPRSNVNYPTANNVPQFNRMPMHQPITVPQQSHMQMNVPFGVPPGPIRGPPPSYPYTHNNPVQPQPNIRMQFNTNQNQSNYQQVRTMPPNQLGPQNQVMTQQNIYPYRPNSLQQFNHPNQYRPPTQAQIRPIINNLPNSLNSYRPQVSYRPQTPFINNGSQDFQQQSMYNQNQAFANPYHSRTNLNQQLPSTLVNNQNQQDPTRYGHQSGNQNLQNNVYGMPQAILPPIRPNVMVDSVGNSRVPANNNADLTTPVLNQLLSSCQNILNHTTRSSNIQQRRQSTPEQIQPGQYSTGNFRGNITEQVVTGSYAASTTSIASTSSSLSTHNTTVTQQSTNTVDSIDSTANCLLTQGFTEFIGLRGQRASGNIRVSVLEKEISDSVQIDSPLEYNRELGGRIRPSLSESNDQSIDKNPSVVDQIRSSSVPQEAMTSTIEEVNNVSTAENVDQTEPMENVEHTVEQEQTKTPSASAVEDTINSSIVDLTTDDDVVLIEDVKPNHEENHFALNPDQNRTSEISEEASTLNVDPAVSVENVKQIIAEQDEVASGVDQRRSSVASTVDIVEPMEDIKPYQEQNQVASGVDQQDVSLEEPSTSTSAISINSSVEEHVDLPEHGAGMQQDDVKPNVEQNPVDTIDLTWMDDVDVEELQKDMRFVFVKDEPAEKANAAVEKDVWVPEEQETVYVEKICFCGGDAIYVCICENAFYCSEDCQNQDWENHQNVCHRLRKDKNNSSSKNNEEDAENDEDE